MSLVRQSFGAVASSYASVVVQALLTFCGNIVLARKLGPDAFGMFTAVLLLSQPFRFVADLGLGAALLQHENLVVTDTRRAIFWLHVSNAIAAVLWVACSYHLAELLGDGRLLWPIRAMAIAFLTAPMMTVSSSLLGRDLRQDHIQIASSVGYFLGYMGVGISLAYLQWGAWSLIIGFLAQQCITTIGLWYAANPPLIPSIGSMSPGLLRFGRHATGSALVTWVILNIDNFTIQRVFGTSWLGTYSAGFNLVANPTNLIVGTLAQVLLPAGARVQTQPHRIARAYLATVDALMILVLPTFATVAVAAKVVIVALYGSNWSNAALVLAPIALAMPWLGLNYVGSALIRARGNSGREFAVQSVTLMVIGILVWLAARTGFAWVPWAVFGAYLLRALVLTLVVCRTLGLGLRQIASSFRTGAVLCAASVLALLIVAPIASSIGASPALQLCAIGGLVALVVLSILYLLAGRSLSPELRSAIGEIAVMVPRPFAFYLRKISTYG